MEILDKSLPGFNPQLGKNPQRKKPTVDLHKNLFSAIQQKEKPPRSNNPVAHDKTRPAPSLAR